MRPLGQSRSIRFIYSSVGGPECWPIWDQNIRYRSSMIAYMLGVHYLKQGRMSLKTIPACWQDNGFLVASKGGESIFAQSNLLNTGAITVKTMGGNWIIGWLGFGHLFQCTGFFAVSYFTTSKHIRGHCATT